ncbi:MAG: hypothetical protein ACLFST_07260, partial [Spirochaetia bacterium]
MSEGKLDYDKLLKEAFWDYTLSKDDLFRTAREGTFREKKYLFEKILFNSSDRVRFIDTLFNQEDMVKLFNSITFNQFNRHAEMTVELAKYFLIDKNIRVKGLEWNK